MTANVIVPESGSRRLTRLIKETSIGVTPAGTWSQLRNTGGDGLSSVIETSESNELSGGGALGQTDQIVTGQTGQFSYSTELSKDVAFEAFFESLLQEAWATDTLLPGSTDITMTIEDELPTVDEYEFLRGARVNTMALTVAANEVVTAEFGGAGTVPGLSATLPLGGATLGAGDPGTITGAIPADVEAGSFVQITNATDSSDDGYYRISAVNAGVDATVEGSFVGGTGDCAFTGISQSDGQTTDPKGIATPFSAGDAVTLEIESPLGSGFQDTLNFGWRVPTMTLNVGTEVSDLREITVTPAYVQVAVNRTIALAFDWHVVNLSPIRLLGLDSEFGLKFRLTDPAAAWYEFTLPRCKFSEGAKGPATNGQEMTGSSTAIGLLNTSSVNIQIDRSA